MLSLFFELRLFRADPPATGRSGDARRLRSYMYVITMFGWLRLRGGLGGKGGKGGKGGNQTRKRCSGGETRAQKVPRAATGGSCCERAQAAKRARKAAKRTRKPAK